jgi:hypothetical protein
MSGRSVLDETIVERTRGCCTTSSKSKLREGSARGQTRLIPARFGEVKVEEYEHLGGYALGRRARCSTGRRG